MSSAVHRDRARARDSSARDLVRRRLPKRRSSFEEFPDVDQERLHALDAVGAFALLAGIVLHATMSFFLPIPAHNVGAETQKEALRVLFFLIHTWRMTMFFVVAGALPRGSWSRGAAREASSRTVRSGSGCRCWIGWIILAPLTIGALIWGVGAEGAESRDNQPR